MSGVQIIEVPADDDGARLDRWFKRLFPHIAHGRVEKLLRTGQVRVDGRRAKGNMRIAAGQAIRIPPLPDPAQVSRSHTNEKDVQFMRSLVLYEDDDLIALNKPAGLATQGGTNTRRHIDGLLPALGDGLRLVHRLDKGTSGVLLVAKSRRSAAMAGKMFQSRSAEKIYWGISNGVPRPLSGEIKGYIGKAELQEGPQVMTTLRHGDPGAKHAHTLYECAAKAGPRAAFIVMKPLTGRKHQLRLHLQLLGAPLIGDDRYVTDRPPPGGLADNLYLHARSLTIPLSKGAPITITAPLPAHFRSAFAALGFHENDASDLPPWENGS